MRHSWATLVASLSLATAASAGPLGGRLLWENIHDTGRFDGVFSVATLGHEVFAAGWLAGGVPGQRDFALRVFDARSGRLLWQDVLDRSPEEFASGVVTDGQRVFVSGTLFSNATQQDWILRAYDPCTRRLLWENVFDHAGRDDFSRGTALAAGHGLVFLGGTGRNAAGQTEWILRAHDAATGALRWQDRIVARSGVYTLDLDAGRLVAGGWSGVAPANDALVRTYDARTGSFLWSHVTPGPPSFAATSWTKVVKARGGQVFADHLIRLQDGSAQAHLTAFDAASGALLWEQVLEPSNRLEIEDLDAAGDGIFTIGSGGPRCTFGANSNCDVVIRAYGAQDGAPRWERRLDLSGTDDHGNLVAARGGAVFVSSTAGPFPPQDACCDVGEGVISAFDGSTGEMLWQTLAGRGAVGVYNMVAAPGGLFVPVRSTERATNDWDFGMHAYATHPRRGAARSPTPYLLTETGTSGARRYDLALDPAVNPGAHGLIPAAEQPDVVVDDPTDDLEQAMATGIGVTFHTVSVPEGTRSLRIGLYDEETDGNDDLDLYVFDADGNLVGVSFTFTSEETVDLPTPAAGDYTVVVHGFETDGPDASYTLFTWALGSAPAGNMTVAPAAPGPGGSPRMTVQWSGLTAGTRYFGAVSYSDATGEVGQTLVSIHPAP